MRKFLKRVHLIFIFALIALVLVGCDKKPVDTEDPHPTPVVDTEDPVISGYLNINYIIGEDAPNYLAGITATDNVDGNLTSSISVDSSLVDLTTEGTYTVTYTVSDAAGNDTLVSIEVIVSVAPLTAAEKAELDIDALVFGTTSALPTSGANGTSFIWSTSNPYVITKKGLIIKPAIGSDPVTVTLTAQVINGDYAATETFDIIVEPRVESVVTSRTTLAFEGTSTEYVVESKEAVDIFFVDNGTVPYVDVETFIDMLEGALESSIISYTPIGDDQLRLDYSLDGEDWDGNPVTDYYTATIDFTENTFTVNTFGFFENYVSSTETDYGEGLNYVDADYVDPDVITIPLGEYCFDLVIYEEAGVTYYLMPFHVADLIFAGGVYYDAYYNGDKIWGIDTFIISGTTPEEQVILDEVRTSSFNSLTMERDLKEASYHYLALALDYFYGLKEDKGVDTFYSLLVNYADDLITRTDSTLYSRIFDIAYALDDLHTSHSFTGYYADPSLEYQITSLGDLGPNTQNYYNGSWGIEDLIVAKFGSTANIPSFRYLDNDKTIVIYITGFSVDTPGEVYKILEALKPTVENIVIDLTFNGGGNLGAVLRIFGYMTEERIQYHSQNPGDNSAVTYYIESDYTAYDYNWFIVSSSVTFSAANLMTSMAKELDFATVVGQPSSGGASSIGVIITPDGSCLLISTNNVLSTRVGNEIDGYEYFSIEYGITPEYYMQDVTSDEELIAVINQANADNAAN
ncbi:MAG: DUF5011 domain-containing protein [Firmicutes bacterium]|nr:DUF5011 domain-containing protein [Bacillota bacterium]